MNKGYDEQLDDFKRKMKRHRVKVGKNAEPKREEVERSEQRQADRAGPRLGDSPQEPGGVE
jgi:hypothetical protein